MEIKLKDGKKIKLKDVSLDERDEMLDSVEYQFDDKGKPLGVKTMHSTITKWLRLGIDGDTSDEFIGSISFDDRTEIFLKMQENLLLGKGKASSSK
tara:strand:+ start:2314 stop:2601 length:288 start_codon:yes stop_codon:yes gene_type:complete